MKGIEELNEIKRRTLADKHLDPNRDEGIRVVVGMATCGIAAGAAPVLQAFEEEIKKRGISNVTVVKTGCIGMCRYEPMVEVTLPSSEKVTYVRITPDKVRQIVSEHLINNHICTRYTIGAAE